MGSSSSYHDSHVVELAGKIMILSILVLSVILISVFFLHLYAKWFWYPRLRLRPQQQDSRRHRRGDGHQSSGVTVLRRGLNPSFLKTIPVISFDPKDFKEGLECTVCLSEVCQGEETRILPKCCHGFHVQCIDMWFHSHSTCPICRDPVSDETAISVENLLETQQQQSSSTDTGVGGTTYFPSNMLFWGDETQVITLTSQLEEANSPSSSSSYAYNSPPRPDLVIDIPTQFDDDDVQDQKSPVTSSSSSSRMRSSLTRILSSGSRRFINPFGSATPNVEQRTRAHL